ncbi:hypothetical protein JCGZ_14611 [Jatropha curcas]|uniref:RRM domain-containing protein n=1 Tax=Jatropha curcas TaxID=180498 RepID=A0A067K989_JATCU|nr:uncharacterized protein LOC105643369 [Jatropha curcas]KDP28840.1 hypothetical protein JCGZ_14611 [Jatropha curcas]
METSKAFIIPQANAARSLFDRMIDMDRGVEESIKAIAFWIWLESRGFPDIITELSSRDDKFLDFIFDEANTVLTSLKKNSFPPNLLRVTITTLAGRRFLSPSVILADKEKVLESILEICKKICLVLFEDILNERGIVIDIEQQTNKGITEYSNSKASAPLKSPLPSLESKLNPFAKEWNPTLEKAPEEDRCLFLTFSNGYPLTEYQITNFFTQKYGPFVERVYVHWPNPKNGKKTSPLFGKVVFRASFIPILILNGQNEVKFWVDAKPLWCKRFDPEKKNRRNS